MLKNTQKNEKNVCVGCLPRQPHQEDAVLLLVGLGPRRPFIRHLEGCFHRCVQPSQVILSPNPKHLRNIS